MRKAPEFPERLAWRDYFQISTTCLMVILGIYILWQTFSTAWAFPSFILGTAFLLFGIFRFRMIWLYFQKKGRRDGI